MMFAVALGLGAAQSPPLPPAASAAHSGERCPARLLESAVQRHPARTQPSRVVAPTGARTVFRPRRRWIAGVSGRALAGAAGRPRSSFLVCCSANLNGTGASADPVQVALDDLRVLLESADELEELDASRLSPTSRALLLSTGIAVLAPGGKLRPSNRSSSWTGVVDVVERLRSATPPPSSSPEPPPAEDRESPLATPDQEAREPSDADLVSDLGRARAFVLASIKHYGGSAKAFPTHRFVEHQFSQADWDRVVRVLKKVKAIRTKTKRGSKATISITSSCGGTLLGLLRRIEHLLAQPKGGDALSKAIEPQPAKHLREQEAANSITLSASVLAAGITAEDVLFAKEAIANAVIVSGADANAVPLRTAGLKQRDITRMSRTLMRLGLVNKSKEKNGLFVTASSGSTLSGLLEVLDEIASGSDPLAKDEVDGEQPVSSPRMDDDSQSSDDDDDEEEDLQPLIMSPEEEKHAVFRALAFVEHAMGMNGPSSNIFPSKEDMPESFAVMYDSNVDFLAAIGMVEIQDDEDGVEVVRSGGVSDLSEVAAGLERLVAIMEGEEQGLANASISAGLASSTSTKQAAASSEDTAEEASEISSEDVHRAMKVVRGAMRKAGKTSMAFPACWLKRRKEYDVAILNLQEWGLISLEENEDGSYALQHVDSLFELHQVLAELVQEEEEEAKVLM